MSALSASVLPLPLRLPLPPSPIQAKAKAQVLLPLPLKFFGVFPSLSTVATKIGEINDKSESERAKDKKRCSPTSPLLLSWLWSPRSSHVHVDVDVTDATDVDNEDTPSAFESASAVKARLEAQAQVQSFSAGAMAPPLLLKKKRRILHWQPYQAQKRKLTTMFEELSAENQDLKQKMEMLKMLKHSLQQQISKANGYFIPDLNLPPKFQMEHHTSKWI